MSTKYVRELLESVDVLNPERAYERIGEALQELRQVEAARAKDAELIQRLVDALEDSRVELCSAIPHLPGIGVKLATSQEAQCRASLAAAEAAGYKPTEP
jgi:hypothetical protein